MENYQIGKLSEHYSRKTVTITYDKCYLKGNFCVLDLRSLKGADHL